MDESAELVLDGFQERVDLVPIPFRDQFDPAVGEVADKAGDPESPSDPAGGRSKADTLNPSGIEDTETHQRHR